MDFLQMNDNEEVPSFNQPYQEINSIETCQPHQNQIQTSYTHGNLVNTDKPQKKDLTARLTEILKQHNAKVDANKHAVCMAALKTKKQRNTQTKNKIPEWKKSTEEIKPPIVTCPFCHGKHTMYYCPFTKEERCRWLMKGHRCFKCFKTTHSTTKCANANCAICGGLHHGAICRTPKRLYETKPVKELPFLKASVDATKQQQYETTTTPNDAPMKLFSHSTIKRKRKIEKPLLMEKPKRHKRIQQNKLGPKPATVNTDEHAAPMIKSKTIHEDTHQATPRQNSQEVLTKSKDDQSTPPTSGQNMAFAYPKSQLKHSLGKYRKVISFLIRNNKRRRKKGTSLF